VRTKDKGSVVAAVMAMALLGWVSSPTAAAVRIEGQVQAGGGAVAGSTVSLWAASADAPARLAQTQTDGAGHFVVSVDQTPAGAVSFYVVANGGTPAVNEPGGDNPALAFLMVLDRTPPAKVVVNEMTTVASVWTNAQFLDGAAIKGPALSLRIAAGNVPNFVDLETGGYGTTIQDAINSTQTPTMANFATLSSLLAGCTTRIRPDACASLFAATTSPAGKTPADTLAAARSVARNAAYQPGKLFALLDAFYPVPQGKTLRRTPYMPYLSYAPSAWVLPLKFTGGGLSAPGKIMFDAEGNAWTGVNFIVGEQASDDLWDGNLSKFAPNGKPLSPATTGFQGGGIEGPGFGTAVDADGNVWVTSTGGKTTRFSTRTANRFRRPMATTSVGS
jgi:hypothetical protein